jgi:hypothetical protein
LLKKRENLDLVILEIQPMKKEYLILVLSSSALLVFLLYSANGRRIKMSMKRKACQIYQFFHQEFQFDCFGVKPRLSHYEAELKSSGPWQPPRITY